MKESEKAKIAKHVTRRHRRVTADNEQGVRGLVTGYKTVDGKIVLLGHVENDDAPAWQSVNPRSVSYE